MDAQYRTWDCTVLQDPKEYGHPKYIFGPLGCIWNNIEVISNTFESMKYLDCYTTGEVNLCLFL